MATPNRDWKPDWMAGYIGCWKCGQPLGYLSGCIDGQHSYQWMPLPNPAFDTPEMREKMRILGNPPPRS